MNKPAALFVAALAVACSPDRRLVGPDAATPAASHSAVPSTVGLASPAWQAKAADLVAQARFSPLAASRAYSLVGVANYAAVQQAEALAGNAETSDGGRSRLEADRGAVAGASAVVLSHLFPSQAQALEEMVDAQADVGLGEVHPAFARGEAIGRAVGDAIVTRAQNDGFTRPFTGTIPVGEGFWISNTTPPTVAGGQLPGVTPWFLTSADQFRPAAPPALGSAAFLADLAEIRQLSDTRTAAQTQIAIFWAQNPGTPTTPGFWMQLATDGVNAHGLAEREATHLYALVSATMFDALISCWDAKQAYWFMRPWQVDAAITVVPEVGKPNHPSYPSGHSCASASAAAVLKTFFPETTEQLDAMVTEAGLSRMYAGIHYRFDIDAGRQIGQRVAALAIAADASGQSVLTPR